MIRHGSLNIAEQMYQNFMLGSFEYLRPVECHIGSRSDFQLVDEHPEEQEDEQAP